MDTVSARETLAEMQARVDAERQAALEEADRVAADQRPHRMYLGVDQGARLRVDCPGQEHCPLWYTDPLADEGGRCGFQVEISEMGFEMLEYHLGPAFWPTTNPFPVRFRWTASHDEPPEIEWWPVGTDDSPAVAGPPR